MAMCTCLCGLKLQDYTDSVDGPFFFFFLPLRLYKSLTVAYACVPVYVLVKFIITTTWIAV